MGISGGPYITRDSSLVLELDAADKNSYSGSGNIWSDLSGNNNTGTLTNGPIFNSANGGSVVFDGTNDYITLGNSIPTSLQIGQGDFAIDFWVYTNGTSAYSICGNLNDQNGTGYFWVVLNSTFTGLHTVQFGCAEGAKKFGTTALDTGLWKNIILSRVGNSLSCYINGIKYGSTATINNFTGTTNIDFLLGMSKSSGNFTAYPLNGRLSTLRIYKNKSLSELEVQQNYNEQKSRFDL